MDFADLVRRWNDGDEMAGNALFSEIDAELNAIAAARLRKEANCSLSTGDLVNEAVLKLSRLEEIKFEGRPHILALVSRLMMQILIDAARKRASGKNHVSRVTLTTNSAYWEKPVDLVALDIAMGELKHVDPERSRIVEMRFFGGMSSAEIGEVLGVSEKTVKRRWASTRAWLADRLGNPA